jgi:hypothetical protein
MKSLVQRSRQLRCERPDVRRQAGMERHTGGRVGLHRIERLMRLQAWRG